MTNLPTLSRQCDAAAERARKAPVGSVERRALEAAYRDAVRRFADLAAVAQRRAGA